MATWWSALPFRLRLVLPLVSGSLKALRFTLTSSLSVAPWSSGLPFVLDRSSLWAPRSISGRTVVCSFPSIPSLPLRVLRWSLPLGSPLLRALCRASLLTITGRRYMPFSGLPNWSVGLSRSIPTLSRPSLPGLPFVLSTGCPRRLISGSFSGRCGWLAPLTVSAGCPDPYLPGWCHACGL